MLILSTTKSMFSNALAVRVIEKRSEEEQQEDNQKLEQVIQDVHLANGFRKYILLLSDLSEQTLDKYYSMTDSCQEFAQKVFTEKRQEEA